MTTVSRVVPRRAQPVEHAADLRVGERDFAVVGMAARTARDTAPADRRARADRRSAARRRTAPRSSRAADPASEARSRPPRWRGARRPVRRAGLVEVFVEGVEALAEAERGRHRIGADERGGLIPAAASATWRASDTSSPSVKTTLPRTPWAGGYCPVRIVACDGPVSGTAVCT